MTHSYISARKKTVVSTELQLLFSFFAITIMMLFLTYLFLVFKDYRFSQQTQDMVETKIELENEVIKMHNQITFIEEEVLLYERISTNNSMLKDSIANLFDLVPDRITLSKAQIEKNSLILYGITPSKDLYHFMLQAPLRSIFSKTYSSFYPAKNGWYRFVSTNYIDNDELDYKESEDEE